MTGAGLCPCDSHVLGRAHPERSLPFARCLRCRLVAVPRPITSRHPLGFLAYQVFGAGERDIMFINGGISNIDAVWDEPSAVRFYDRLASLGRVIQYDMRGSGVSDPIPGNNTWLPLEGNMDDVRAVMDAAGSDRAVVYGDTEGGLSAMMLAATHPERVSALILVNAVPRILRADDYPIGAPQDVADSLSEQYIAQHGTTGDLLRLTAPSVADDPRFRAWFTRYQRLANSHGLVKRTFEWFYQVDARATLPLIHAPTLVVARRDARYHRPEYGEYIAQHIEGAELRLVDGADTLLRSSPATSGRPSTKWRSSSPADASRRASSVSSRRCCSPTSSTPRPKRPRSATNAGSTFVASTTASSAPNWSVSGAGRSA